MTTTRRNLHLMTFAAPTSLLVAFVLCMMMAFCADAAAETINRKAVTVWRRGYLEMNEAKDQLKAKNDREAFHQFRTAVKYFEEVRKTYPDFEPAMVEYRLNECRESIKAIQDKHPNDLFFKTEKEVTDRYSAAEKKNAELEKQNDDLAKKNAELEKKVQKASEDLAASSQAGAKLADAEKKNQELEKKNKALEEKVQLAAKELNANADSEIANRMLTAANEFSKLLNDDRADPKTVADANARYQLYVKEVKRIHELLYPKNYVIGGLVKGVWMIDPKTGKPVFIKPEEIRKRGLPVILLN